MNQAVVVVECAIEYQGRILMITRLDGGHAGGLLAFPGGKVELEADNHGLAHDLLKDAAKREVLEEVGIALKDPLIYATSNFFMADNTPVVDVIFFCSLDKTNPRVNPSPREVAAYEWMTKEQIEQSDKNSPWVKAYLNALPIQPVSVELA